MKHKMNRTFVLALALVASLAIACGDDDATGGTNNVTMSDGGSTGGGSSSVKTACQNYLNKISNLSCLPANIGDQAKSACDMISDQTPACLADYYDCLSNAYKCVGSVPDVAGAAACQSKATCTD